MNDNYKIVSETVIVNEDRKTVNSVLGIVFGWEGMWPAVRAIRASLDDGTRRCGVFAVNSWKRVACILRVRIEVLNKLLVIAKKNKNEALIKEIQLKLEKYNTKLQRVLIKSKGQERTPSKKTAWI